MSVLRIRNGVVQMEDVDPVHSCKYEFGQYCITAGNSSNEACELKTA